RRRPDGDRGRRVVHGESGSARRRRGNHVAHQVGAHAQGDRGRAAAGADDIRPGVVGRVYLRHGGGRHGVGAADSELRRGRVGHGLVEGGGGRQRRALLDRTGRRVRDGGGQGRVIDGEGGAARWRGAHDVAGEVSPD